MMLSERLEREGRRDGGREEQKEKVIDVPNPMPPRQSHPGHDLSAVQPGDDKLILQDSIALLQAIRTTPLCGLSRRLTVARHSIVDMHLDTKSICGCLVFTFEGQAWSS